MPERSSHPARPYATYSNRFLSFRNAMHIGGSTLSVVVVARVAVHRAPQSSAPRAHIVSCSSEQITSSNVPCTPGHSSYWQPRAIHRHTSLSSPPLPYRKSLLEPLIQPCPCPRMTSQNWFIHLTMRESSLIADRAGPLYSRGVTAQSNSDSSLRPQASRSLPAVNILGRKLSDAFIALACFDYSLTFTREVERIWKHEFSTPVVLFYLVRYPAMISALNVFLNLMGWRGISDKVRVAF